MGKRLLAQRRLLLAATSRHFERGAKAYLATFFPQHACILIFAPAGARTPAFIPTEGNAGTRRLYREGLENDLWFQHCRPAPGMKVVRHSDHTPQAKLNKSDFYRKNLEPRGWQYGVSLIFWSEAAILACLTLCRATMDYESGEMECLAHAHGLFAPALAKLGEAYRMKEDLRAIKRASYCHFDGSLLVRRPDEIIAAGRSAARIVGSWPGDPLHTLTRAPTHLPSDLLHWCEDSKVRLPGKWQPEIVPVFQPSSPYLLFRLKDESLSQTPLWPELTDAEKEIVRGVIAGRSNRQIARSRNTSAATVKNQLSKLLAKTQLRSRVQLAVLYSGPGAKLISGGHQKLKAPRYTEHSEYR